MDFQTAHDLIRDHVSRTPVTRLEPFGLYLKWESQQPTRSFKVRGAFNRLLSDSALPGKVITGSAGNHGLAVSLAARKLGIQAEVYVPEPAPAVKVDRMRDLGAVVIRVPGLFADAEARAIRTAREENVPFISAYNDPAVISGAGTIALELLEQTQARRILVPVGGGGLIAGVGLCAREIDPSIEIIGVLSEASPYLYHQFYDGTMDNVVEQPTLTDGLAGAVEPGSITINLITRAADAVIQVQETDIARAIAILYRETGETVEGSGAVGRAARVGGQGKTREKVTPPIVTGGKKDTEVQNRGRMNDTGGFPTP
jgi:threonine dehydratase